MCPLSDSAKSFLVLDRDLDQDKSVNPSGPRIRCPLCGWSPRKEDCWACDFGSEGNTFDAGGVCPRLLAPVDFDPVPIVRGCRIAPATLFDGAQREEHHDREDGCRSHRCAPQCEVTCGSILTCCFMRRSRPC